ncbi:hypothetical protein GmHk_17G048944 [Glycine max]|nr:hypothetical protein GmHk_17G048944 [Glycine max]
MHSITYNQDLVNPTILAGWKEVKDFYGLSRNHQVTMTPFRQSIFFLTIFKILLNDYKVSCSSLASNSAPYIINTKNLYLSNFKIIYISKMNLMLISGCIEYHVLIYGRCKIHPSEFERDYGMQVCL